MEEESSRQSSFEVEIIQSQRQDLTRLLLASLRRRGAGDALPDQTLVVARIGLRRRERPGGTIGGFTLPPPLVSLCGVEEELQGLDLGGRDRISDN